MTGVFKYIDPLPTFPSVADHNKFCKQGRDNVCNVGYDPRMVFVLLLNTAQFEFVLKEVRS